MGDALMRDGTPDLFEIVVIGDSDAARSLELVGAEGVVLGVSEDEESHERWFAVQVGDMPAVMLPLGDLTRTSRSVPRSLVYPGDRLRVSDDGRILGDGVDGSLTSDDGA